MWKRCDAAAVNSDHNLGVLIVAKAKKGASKVVTGTGISMGSQTGTDLGARMEAAMHEAIRQGRDKGESDDEVRARIHKARDEVLKG